MGSSKSGKCSKGKSSKKGPDYSESADANATLVTSSNDTSAASGSTTTATYVEEPPNSPNYSEDPIAEEDVIDVDSDSDADSASEYEHCHQSKCTVIARKYQISIFECTACNGH